MIKKYQPVKSGEGDWTIWVKPDMDAYQFACCDCSLVHTLQFKIVERGKLTRKFSDGNHEYAFTNVRGKKYQTILRAKRNNRATGQLRRRKKKALDS